VSKNVAVEGDSVEWLGTSWKDGRCRKNQLVLR